MSSQRGKLIAISLLLFAGGPVYGISFGSGRFDQLVGKAEIVVKARVARIDKPPFEMIAFTAHITDVLTSDGATIPDQLHLNAPDPIWPKDLGVPFVENHMVLLILRREKEKLSVVNSLGAILPAPEVQIRHEERSPTTRKVFEELQACLPQTANERARGLILVRLSQLGAAEDEGLFLPYRKSENPWLRRAARASLLRLKPTPERVSEAVDDFADHLATGLDDYLFWQMYEDIRWSARCGDFGMAKDLVARAHAYLPIYRVLIDKARSDDPRASIAVEALKSVGTREDIRRLYKYIDHQKAWMRHDVLEGIGRILDLEIKRPLIPSYEMPLPAEVKSWEEKTRSIIEQTLAKEGLL